MQTSATIVGFGSLPRLLEAAGLLSRKIIVIGMIRSVVFFAASGVWTENIVECSIEDSRLGFPQRFERVALPAALVRDACEGDLLISGSNILVAGLLILGSGRLLVKFSVHEEGHQRRPCPSSMVYSGLPELTSSVRFSTARARSIWGPVTPLALEEDSGTFVRIPLQNPLSGLDSVGIASFRRSSVRWSHLDEDGVGMKVLCRTSGRRYYNLGRLR